MRMITAVNKTVKTSYKTFTNATEVTGEDGTKYYYTKGFGSIKTIERSGAVIFQLIEVH